MAGISNSPSSPSPPNLTPSQPSKPLLILTQSMPENNPPPPLLRHLRQLWPRLLGCQQSPLPPRLGAPRPRQRLLPSYLLSASAHEAMDFLSQFERDCHVAATSRPIFTVEGFMEALQRIQDDVRVPALAGPPDMPEFCEGTLCSEVVVAFVNENFMAWGGSIRASEGFKMSNSLNALRFPFCAVVTQATNQRIALLQQMILGRRRRVFWSVLCKFYSIRGIIPTY